MTLNLVSKNNPILSQAASEVEYETDLKQLIFGMMNTVKRNMGLGLAANQIGRLDRVIVINTKKMQQAIINPAITKRYSQTAKKKEGCLSYPSLFVFKRRAIRIVVEGFDENWTPVEFKLKGVEAQVIQHEIDHLNGITIGNKK